MLPAHVTIWAGGSSPALRRREIPGMVPLTQLGDIAQEVRKWRAAHAPKAPQR
jgi:hypothetical protein